MTSDSRVLKYALNEQDPLIVSDGQLKFYDTFIKNVHQTYFDLILSNNI